MHFEAIIFLWRSTWSFIISNARGSHLIKIVLCYVCLIMVKGFWRRRFLNVVNVFSLSFIPSLEQTYIPLIQGFFVPSLVETDPVILEKKIFYCCHCSFVILFDVPKERSIWIPCTYGYIVSSLVWIGLMVWEKMKKRWKVYRRTGNMPSEKLSAQVI